MHVEQKSVRYHWQRIRQSWKQASGPHYSPEYRSDTERSLNHRYYR